MDGSLLEEDTCANQALGLLEVCPIKKEKMYGQRQYEAG